MPLTIRDVLSGREDIEIRDREVFVNPPADYMDLVRSGRFAFYCVLDQSAGRAYPVTSFSVLYQAGSETSVRTRDFYPDEIDAELPEDARVLRVYHGNGAFGIRIRRAD